MTDVVREGMRAFSGFATAGRHGRRDKPAGVTFSEIGEAGIATVTARKGRVSAVASALAGELSLTPPDGPAVASACSESTISCVGIGPGRWLVVAHRMPGGGMEGILGPVVGDAAAVVDQSHGLALVRLAGGGVRETLAKGTGVDLHPRVFGVGRAGTTSIAHIGVTFWCTSEPSEFHLTVPRSMAGSFWDWLLAASGSAGLEVL